MGFSGRTKSFSSSFFTQKFCIKLVFQRVVISHALTQTHPKISHTHLHLPKPSQKKQWSHPAKKSNTRPHPAKKWQHPPKERSYSPTHKESHMSNTWYIHEKYSLFTILAGVFISETDWHVNLFLLNTFETAFQSIVSLFSIII